MDLDDGRVYADFVKDIVIGNNIEMKSDGKAIRAFCYISDATIAFLKVLLEGESGQAYNVGNDNCITTIVDLAEKLVSLFPEKNLVVNRINQTNSNYLNSAISVNIPVINKIKSLGWSPQIGIEEGFVNTIKYYLK
jgi:nucleoside-diphosphate-sugar epimerase